MPTHLRSSTDPYDRFLCHLLGDDEVAVDQRFKALDFSWERLFQTCLKESVLPALAAAKMRQPLSAPDEVSDFLSAILALNRERNLRIWQELETTVQLLNGIGIEPTLLKGAAYFADGVYPDLGERYLLDLDLLIPEKDLDTAFKHLAESGYSYDNTDQFGCFRHHYPPLRRSSVPIELHRALGLGPCLSVLPAEEVIRDARPMSFKGLRVRLPSATHLVTHLIMHSQIQHSYNERIWPRVRAMHDFSRLQGHYRGAINWSEVERRFQTAGQLNLLRLHLLDVSEALGLKLPIEFRSTPVMQLRALRRRILRRVPSLRYLDPIYMFSAIFVRRLRVLRNVLRAPDGIKRFAMQLSTPGLLERLFLDALQGGQR